MQTKILIVDDEDDILELLRCTLIREGCEAICACSGEEALKKAKTEKPDIAVLDLMLQGIGGLETASRLKTDPNTKSIPIMMLTAKGEEADIIAGLEIGADDYITKPFSPRVLTARIKAVIRRANKENNVSCQELKFNNLTIHCGMRTVFVKQQPVQLTFTEFQILCFLSYRPGWVFTRSQIVDAVRGNDYNVTDRSVDVQIAGLRKKLADCGKYIETVRGVGYRFNESKKGEHLCI